MEFQVALEEIDDFAADFWAFAGSRNVFAFHGEMGAGKTTIINALCKYKGVKDAVSSPTFSIINEYHFLENEVERKIFHIDLYRLNTVQEVIHAGVEDCLYSGAVCFVEWAEKAIEIFSPETVHVFVEQIDMNQRLIRIRDAKASSAI